MRISKHAWKDMLHCQGKSSPALLFCFFPCTHKKWLKTDFEASNHLSLILPTHQNKWKMEVCTPHGVWLVCVCCISDNCLPSRRCYRNPFIRSPRWTSVCRWRTRSWCGSCITETSAAPTRFPPPPLHLPTLSASSRPAAPASYPALRSHPDNDGAPASSKQTFSFFELSLWNEEPCLFPVYLATQQLKPWRRQDWHFLYRDTTNCFKKKKKRNCCCTEALNSKATLFFAFHV